MLVLAACGGRSRLAEPRDPVPLTRIAETADDAAVPFSAIVPQRGAGEELTSPYDEVLNTRPQPLNFDPSPFLPEDFGRVIEWSGRAGETGEMMVNPDTGMLTGIPAASTTVFLRATNAAGEQFDVVVPVTVRTVLGDSARSEAQQLDGTDGTAWFVLGSTADDILRGSDRSDDLRGGAGNDILEGGGDADWLDGGSCRDTASYESSTSGVTVRLAEDGSALQASGGHAEGDVMTGIEDLAGSPFDDVLHGNDKANRFTGGAGRDRFGIDLQPSNAAGADIIFDFEHAPAAGEAVDQFFMVGLNQPTLAIFFYRKVLVNGINSLVIFSNHLDGNERKEVLEENILTIVLNWSGEHRKSDFWQGDGHRAAMPEADYDIDPIILDIA